MHGKVLAIAGLSLSVALMSTPSVAGAELAVAKCVPPLKKVRSSGKRWSAFAANKPNKNGQACGWTTGFPIKQTAVTMALSECRVSEKKHPTWGITGTCRIIYVK